MISTMINLTNVISITTKQIPTSDHQVANKKFVDDAIGDGNVLRLIQTLQNYLKVSVGDDTYNLTKYNKNQMADTTIIKNPNTGKHLLQRRNIKSNDKNNNSQIENLNKSTKTSSPTFYSGATILPPIDNAFMFIETSSKTNTSSAYVILERTDVIRITKITFYYKRLSILSNTSPKSMVRFGVQLLLENNTWNTKYHMGKNSN